MTDSIRDSIEREGVSLPEPVAHVHSNGEFCYDRQPPGVVLWPLDLYTAEQMRAYGEACGVASPRVEMAKDYRSVGWRAVTKSKKDGYVWLSSRIVREAKDAESIVKQWHKDHPRGDGDPLCFAVEQVFATSSPSHEQQQGGSNSPEGVMVDADARARAAYEAATACDRKAPGGAMTWGELSARTKQEWRRATAGVAMGDCGNADCGWRGPISECSYLGAIGPCCPMCREIVEPDAPDGVSVPPGQTESRQTPMEGIPSSDAPLTGGETE